MAYPHVLASLFRGPPGEDDTVPASKYNRRRLGRSALGFDTAVIAGTTQQLTATFNLTSFLGLTVSIGLIGTVIGAMSAGIIGQRIGGREALRIMAVLYTISALGCAFAWNWPALLVFRFIGGLSVDLRFWDLSTSPNSHPRSGAAEWLASFRST
jgi:MFS family permease